jgi:cation diffusion facilitator family transporter
MLKESQIHLRELERQRHSHDFAGDSAQAEKSTTMVAILSAAMMAVEVAAGWSFGSLALLADGWHMATHVAAFGIALFAYRYARRHAKSPRFTFGTGKVSVLGGFASAVALAVVALIVAQEAVLRMFKPQAIRFNEALLVAVIGLLVNLVSGLMLRERPEAGAERGHRHHDHNLRSAYFHVLADALTSVLAIVALSAGKYLGWVMLDPAMGLVGAGMIVWWSYGLIRDSGSILMDSGVDERIRVAIREAIERDADNRLADLHVWHVGSSHYSAGVSVVTHRPREPEHYKRLLKDIPHLAHVLVEVNRCEDKSCHAG